MSGSNRPVPRIDEIKQVVVEFYKLAPSAMTTKRRHFKISHPRQVAMFLSRNLTPSSYPLIGRLFGRRDHTTVLHACRAVSRRAEADPALYSDIDAIERAVLDRAERRMADAPHREPVKLVYSSPAPETLQDPRARATGSGGAPRCASAALSSPE